VFSVADQYIQIRRGTGQPLPHPPLTPLNLLVFKIQLEDLEECCKAVNCSWAGQTLPPNRYSRISVRFIPRDAMHSADYAVARCPSVRLSVCLSHAGIMSKRLKIPSHLFSLLGSHTIKFFRTNLYGNIPTGTTLTAASYEKIAIFN